MVGWQFGEFMEAELNNFSGIKKEFIWIRVKIDVFKPLRDHFILKVGRSEGCVSHKALLRYEKLPTFYFRCGVIGHGERFCRRNYENASGDALRMFGPELRATSRRNTKLTIGDK